MSWPPSYPWLEKAAAEARAESRRYWFPGGPADRLFPVHPDVKRHWPLPGDVPVDERVLQRSRKLRGS